MTEVRVYAAGHAARRRRHRTRDRLDRRHGDCSAMRSFRPHGRCRATARCAACSQADRRWSPPAPGRSSPRRDGRIDGPVPRVHRLRHRLHDGTSPNATFSLTADRGLHQHARRQLDLDLELRARAAARSSSRGPVLCVNQGDTVTVVLHNSLPEATSIMFPGIDNVQVNGVAGAARVQRAPALTSLVPAAAANGGSVTYSFVASQARHLPVRERHRRRQAGPDGPVRRPRRPPRRARRLGLRQRRRSPSASSCRRRVRDAPLRDRPEPPLGDRARAAVRRHAAPPALLADQRARVPGHHRAERRGLAAQPALQLARSMSRCTDPPRVGPNGPTSAGPDPLPETPGRAITRSTRTARTAACSRATRRRCSTPPATTSRTRRSRSRSAPARPGTRPTTIDEPGALRPGQQPDPGHGAAAPEPDLQGRRDLLQRQPATSGHKGQLPVGTTSLQRVRRVLHGHAQPRAVRGRPTTTPASAGCSPWSGSIHCRRTGTPAPAASR